MKLTKQINIGGVPVGGGAPIAIQSMTNTDTRDAKATLAQIRALAEAGCDARVNIRAFLQLVAFISINLGVMNLLPLPALDGGRLVFLIIEGIRRKPVPPKYEGLVHAAGLMLLLMLMVYVTGHDILRLLPGRMMQ